MARALLALFSLLAVACSGGNALAPPTLEPLEITNDGTFFRDRMGRVVILRGATYTLTEGEAPVGNFGGDGERAIVDMERLGMNLVRLPLSWRQIEPRPRRFASYYFIERVDPVLRWAAAHGMAIVLSMRAWPYGACDEGDDSVPEWVCRTAARAARAARASDSPTSADPACAFWTARDPGGATLLDHYLDAWGVVARNYAGDPRVIGLDLIDEPSGTGCFEEKPFLHGILTPFFRRLATNVRTFGYRNAILFEPPVAPGAPLPSEARRLGFRTVYAPHLYGQRFGPGAQGLGPTYDVAAAQAKQLRAPLLIGEYGGDQPPDDTGYRGSSRAFVEESLAELDRLRIGGAYYALRPQSKESARVEIGDVAYALAHPYARRIAGIPLEMKFDQESRELRLHFEEDAKRKPPDPTEIYLPRPLYAGSFDVQVSPAGRWTYDQQSQRLLVYRGGSDDGTYEVVVRPGTESRSIDRSGPPR
ncbi:MAG: hypothetical protein FJ144_19680 [Deltaproteobacteria bacterium]|nr:hypothetical protein [Deltaproteobacteria bacterium]